MHMNSGVTRGWEARHPQFMKTRDAGISFNCFLPDFIQVNELINGEIIQSQTMQRHPDVVTKMETKYMFYADEAASARKLVSRGHSCFFNVYFREP
jgi:hypothetical protein